MISYDSPSFWLSYYKQQAVQSGHGIDGFHGMRFQRGAGLGSFFKSLFRIAVPVLKQAAKSTAIRVGKHAATAVGHIAADMANGTKFTESVANRGKQATADVLRESADALQGGNGLGYRPRFAASLRVNTKRKIKGKKVSARKRRRVVKSDVFAL